MRVYELSKSLYEKLLSRGMYLVCRACGMPIRPSTTKDLATGRLIPIKVVSKPSKYRQWTCVHCWYKYGKRRPSNIFRCDRCNTEGPERTTPSGKRTQEPIIKDVGRKFYCKACFNGTVIDIPNGDYITDNEGTLLINGFWDEE